MSGPAGCDTRGLPSLAQAHKPLLPRALLHTYHHHTPTPTPKSWHYYNRYKPYNNITGEVDTSCISADGSTYTNPKFPTVIISGASGDREDDSPYDAPFPTQTGTQNYGYGLFTPVDKNKATWTFKTVQADGPGPADYSDSLTIIKD